MKTKTLAFTILAGSLLATAAQAQVNIYISGAVAFRDSAYKAVRNLYGANLTSQNPADPAGSPAGSALKVTWTGTIPTLFGGQTVNVFAFYNGAVAGVQNLTQNQLVSFLANATPGDTNLANVQADLAFSSVYQNSTAFTTPVLADAKFGVTPVVWVKSVNSPANLTNITTQQIKALAANGALPISYFTGDTSTNGTNLVHFISRDPTAGQRVIAFKDSGFTGNPLLYVYTNGAWNSTVSPNGLSSTGPIVTQLNSFGPAISYLTLVDAISVNGGANILSYNGSLPFAGTFSGTSNNFTPVITGEYSQWGYEHILNRTTASANIVSFRNALITEIGNVLTTSFSSVKLNQVQVTRNADGGPISP